MPDAALEQIFAQMPPDEQHWFYENLTAYLRTQPIGRSLIATALSKTQGLGQAAVGSAINMASVLATLGTAALTVGVGLYDKKKERQDAASAEKRAYAAAAKQVEAEMKQAKALAKQRATTNVTYVKYALWGVAGLSVLGLVGVVLMNRSRGRR